MVAEENHSPTSSDEDRTTQLSEGEQHEAEDYAHQDNHNPDEALKEIRQNMKRIAREYADGAISRTQFNALYAHYSEKRTIIEKLLERVPNSDAWKAAARPGQTTFLRQRYTAKPVYYLVFAHGNRYPLSREGHLPPGSTQAIYDLLQTLWQMKNKKVGVARKQMKNGAWIVLALVELAYTIVVFSLQPSLVQIELVRDLHNDFEQANYHALKRGLSSDRMVFTQRALLDETDLD